MKVKNNPFTQGTLEQEVFMGYTEGFLALYVTKSVKDGAEKYSAIIIDDSDKLLSEMKYQVVREKDGESVTLFMSPTQEQSEEYILAKCEQFIRGWDINQVVDFYLNLVGFPQTVVLDGCKYSVKEIVKDKV